MKRFLTGGMVAVMMSLAMGTVAYAAGNKASITVSANVLANLSQTMIHQERTLIVTKENLEKGYVDITSGTVIYVKSNSQNGYFLDFNIDESFVNEVRMIINGRSVSVSSGPALIQQPFPGKAGETLQITYRLFLSPGMNPGSYQWPVMVAATL